MVFWGFFELGLSEPCSLTQNNGNAQWYIRFKPRKNLLVLYTPHLEHVNHLLSQGPPTH